MRNTRKNLVSQRFTEGEKNLNASKVKENKRPERIFSDLICQLVEEIPKSNIKDLPKIKVQQILVKAKRKA